MLDGDMLERIWVQLEDTLNNFGKVYDLYKVRVRITIRTHDFLIFNYRLYPLKMYLGNAEISYTQTEAHEIKLSEDNAVKLLALLRLEGY